jgi:CDP-6-deoxy-D-xylo-4-hexulose-3-dehydrase
MKNMIKVPFAGRVYDHREIELLKQAADEFWLTSGHFVNEFENGLRKFIDPKARVMAVNSGSAANLIAFMTLTSHSLGERRIKRGDEVITVAAGFPTTISPIVNYGAVPVFVDITIPQYNIDVNYLEEAYNPLKTKAIMIAHTLGNPFNIQTVANFCHDKKLWLIEDCADALGSEYKYNKPDTEHVGTVGDLGTLSFYPAHMITTGEGGAVFTLKPELGKLVVKFRDWGRSCICPTGYDNTCGQRFTMEWGSLPYGYDHKYVYDELGYNCKMTEMQGAIGVAQLEKLKDFIQIRRKNWEILKYELIDLQDYFYLPESFPGSIPCWFGFMLTIRDSSIDRRELQRYLEKNGIQTRLLFAGNIVKQPCFANLRNGIDYKIIGELSNTDKVMKDGIWVGVYPGLNKEHMIYIGSKIKEFI